MNRDQFSQQTEDGYLGAAGSPHLAFFWEPLQLSFVWNGVSEPIDVCHGGYGEPVVLHLPAFIAEDTTAALLDRFREHCVRRMEDPAAWSELVDAGVVASIQLVPDLLPL